MEQQENQFWAVDMLIDYIKQMPQPEVKIIDPARIASVTRAKDVLDRALMEDGNYSRAYIRFDPLFSAAIISAETDDLVFCDPGAFSKAIADADNFEIYPLETGRIRISITFYRAFRA